MGIKIQIIWSKIFKRQTSKWPPSRFKWRERAKVTALACSEPPEGYARWSLRLLADKLVELEYVESISFKQVSNILKKMNCSLTEKNNGVLKN